jgi:hypothetical protein
MADVDFDYDSPEAMQIAKSALLRLKTEFADAIASGEIDPGDEWLRHAAEIEDREDGRYTLDDMAVSTFFLSYIFIWGAQVAGLSVDDARGLWSSADWDLDAFSRQDGVETWSFATPEGDALKVHRSTEANTSET